MKSANGCWLILLTACASLAAYNRAYGLYSPGPAVPASAHATQGQAYLGVTLRDVAEEQVPALKLRDTHGVEIVLVDHDAPAGKAGFHEHDVILQMNGQAVVNQDQIRRMLHECVPGKMVVFLVSRDGMQMTVSARMSTQDEVERQAWTEHLGAGGAPDASPESSVSSGPASGPMPSAPAVHAGNSFIGSILMNSAYTGAMLEQMSTQLAQFFGVPAGAGLLVRSVVDNSPAAAAGLHAGDVVLRVNERNVSSTGDWAKAVKSSHGHALAVIVLRDKKEQTLTLTPDGHHRSSLEELIQAPERTFVAHLNLSWFPHSGG